MRRSGVPPLRADCLVPDCLALVVKDMVAERAPGPHQTGLRVSDVIVAVDGKTAAMTEGQFLAYVRLSHPCAYDEITKKLGIYDREIRRVIERIRGLAQEEECGPDENDQKESLKWS